jgi:hypothetical protein
MLPLDTEGSINKEKIYMRHKIILFSTGLKLNWINPRKASGNYMYHLL